MIIHAQVCTLPNIHQSYSPCGLRVYFWMAMQMMKGIVIILVINHYVTQLADQKEVINRLHSLRVLAGAGHRDLPPFAKIPWDGEW